MILNPQTDLSSYCRHRAGANAKSAAKYMAEANYHACVRNARANRYTREWLVTQYP
jgi:hypothetical protein